MEFAASTPSIREFLRSYPFRVGLYAVITLVVFEAIYASVRAYGSAAMGSENGPLEIAQVVLALIGAFGLFYAAKRTRIGRAGLVLCASLVTYAAARESDSLFETYFFDDAYKWMIGLPLALLCVGTMIADRQRMLGGMMWLMRHPAATLFAIAGVFLCFVCQILDRPEMWSSVAEADARNDIKSLIEEFSELFAYLLLAFSGVESAILANQQKAILCEIDDQANSSNRFPAAA